jgi:hypothetical protein
VADLGFVVLMVWYVTVLVVLLVQTTKNIEPLNVELEAQNNKRNPKAAQ